MDINLLREVINDSINKSKNPIEEKVSLEWGKYCDSREEYESRIYSLTDEQNPRTGNFIDIDRLINNILEYLDDKYIYFNNGEATCVTNEELFSVVSEEGRDNIKKILDEDEYKGIELQEIATLLRVNDAIREDPYYDYDKSREDYYYNPGDCYVRDESRENFIKEVVGYENDLVRDRIDRDDEWELQASNILEQIKNDPRLEGNDVKIGLEEINKLNPWAGSKERREHLIELTCAKSVIGTATPSEINEQVMQILYENNWQGDIENSEVALMYKCYCQEQTIKKQQQELDEIKKSTKELQDTIVAKDKKIVEQGENIEKQERTINSQKATIKQQDEKITLQSNQINGTIEESDAMMVQLQNENNNLIQQNSMLENENGDLRQQNGMLVTENGNLRQQNGMLGNQNNRLETSNSELRDTISRLKATLVSAVEFCQKVKNSKLGRIFFRKQIQTIDTLPPASTYIEYKHKPAPAWEIRRKHPQPQAYTYNQGENFKDGLASATYSPNEQPSYPYNSPKNYSNPLPTRKPSPQQQPGSQNGARY